MGMYDKGVTCCARATAVIKPVLPVAGIGTLGIVGWGTAVAATRTGVAVDTLVGAAAGD
jgi:hypothetical protein